MHTPFHIFRFGQAESRTRVPYPTVRLSDCPAVPHFLRSSFRDWASERTTYPRDMAEIALSHLVGSEVERAYRRGDMLDKRREMMDAWAKFVLGQGAEKYS